MNIKKALIPLIILTTAFTISCGKKSGFFPFETLIIPGKVNLSQAQGANGPAFVMVTNTDDIDLIENFSMETVLGVFTVAPDGTFAIDLSNIDVFPGQSIYLMAFIDNDYTGGIPIPTAGDWLGIYFNSNTWQTAYIVGGENDDLTIDINRRVYDFNAFVSGTVNEDEPGDLMMIAYAGEISSMDMTAIDFDNIIGYKRITKPEGPVPYSMKILPYGSDVPVENVYIIGLLDMNNNGKPDGGDKIGFYSANGDKIPSLITINEGSLSGIDIEMSLSVPEPSDIPSSISGTITRPSGLEDSTSPVFVIVAETDDPNGLFDDPTSSLKAFTKLEAGETNFYLDLSTTDLEPGDAVMVTALLDMDNVGGFPNPTPGDWLGVYINQATWQMTYIVGSTDPVNIAIDRQMYDFSATVSGTVQEDEAGDVMLIAYAGEINSMDMTTINTDNVIGYKKISKSAGPCSYEFDIMPMGRDVPIENVYIMAQLDRNGNGTPDAGDKIGFYSDNVEKIPTQITINSGSTAGINIEMTLTLPEPSGTSSTIAGSIARPSGYESSTSPVFVMIAGTDDPNALLDNPVDYIKAFVKLNQGETAFSIDLSKTDLVDGDTVLIAALLDLDNTGGFPNPTNGDWMGVYINNTTWQMTYTVGSTDPINIPINRQVYDFTASVSGTVNENDAGDIILIAYAGEINSMDMSAIDTDNIVGYKKMTKSAGPVSYDLDIMPMGRNVPIENVYIIAQLDRNGNGMPDAGDRIGFYSNNDNSIPTHVTINSGNMGGIDINMAMNIPAPSGYSISVNGNFTAPSGYNSGSQPIFIIIARTDNPSDLFMDPMNSIKAIQKLNPGATSFSIDLSYTDLVPGDNVLALALWDLDYAGGFPNPTAGDKVGFYENTDVSNPGFGKVLSDGANTIAPSGSWMFRLNKNMFDYETEIQFKIDPGGRPGGMSESNNLIAIAVYHEGVNDDGAIPDYQINDIDYALGMSILPYRNDSNYVYTMHLFPSIDERISNTANMDIYIYVLYDRDGNNMASEGDDVAAYWRTKTICFIPMKVPKKWNLTSDAVNVLTAPDGDSGNPYAVRFIDQTY